MLKKIMTVSLLLLSIALPVSAESTTYYKYYGTTSTTTNYLIADVSNEFAYWETISVGGSSGEVIWYSYDTEIGRSPTPGSDIQAPSNANALKLHSLDGNEVYAIDARNTSTVTPYLIFDTPSTVPEGQSQYETDMLKIVKQISNSTNSNGQTLSNVLSEVKSMTSAINSSNDLLGQILQEVQTSQSYSVPSIVNKPSVNDHKPNQPTTKFEDTTVYFQDSGISREAPDALPIAPEPENWKDENGVVMESDSELVKDEQLQKDEQLTKDIEQTKDEELSRSPVLDQSPVLEIEPVLEQEPVLTQTEVLEQDSVLQQDAELSRDPEMTQNNFYEQAPIDETLPRWKSN